LAFSGDACEICLVSLLSSVLLGYWIDENCQGGGQFAQGRVLGGMWFREVGWPARQQPFVFDVEVPFVQQLLSTFEYGRLSRWLLKPEVRPRIRTSIGDESRRMWVLLV